MNVKRFEDNGIERETKSSEKESDQVHHNSSEHKKNF